MITNNQNEVPKHVPKRIPATLAIGNTPLALVLLFMVLPWVLDNGGILEKIALLAHGILVISYYVAWIRLNYTENSIILWGFSSIFNGFVTFATFPLISTFFVILFGWFLYSLVISVLALYATIKRRVYFIRSR